MRRVMEAAYAKVNLTLTVTGRRADGYHTIESLFQSVSLCDTVSYTHLTLPTILRV